MSCGEKNCWSSDSSLVFWNLGESVNVISGLGFNGYDEKGVSRWDLIDNADIVKVEVGDTRRFA